MKARHLKTIFACAAVGVSLAACGAGTDTHFGDNEGIYVHVGSLTYQVQISRQLNPYSTEDSNYIAGVSAKEAQLTPTQQWFGVFMLVMNNGKKAATAADEYYITDTENDVYTPIGITGPNVFAYHPALIAPGSQLPLPGSPAADGPTAGEELLFKIPYSTDDNRPWDLHIVNSADPAQRAIVVLDV